MMPSAAIQQAAEASALRAFTEPRDPAQVSVPATARRRSKERVRIALYAALLLADALAIAAGFLLGNLVRFHDPLAPTGLNFILLLLPLYAVLSFTTRNYSIEVLQ